MRFALILSNDWELYGDGSGSYFEIQHQPLLDLLDVADRHGAKITVFAEVGQQWAHQAVRSNAPWAAKVADAWENILRETIRRGSDVQLHLHAQWLNPHLEGNKWSLDYNLWAIGALERQRVFDVLSRGKALLEELLRAEEPSYVCNSFRAGAYCIEPSAHVVSVLEEVGLQSDSSVTKGMVDPIFYNYRDAYSNLEPWRISSNDVKYRGNDTRLVELPIASLPGWDAPALRRLAPKLFFLLKFGILIPDAELRWSQERERVLKQRYPSSRRPFMKQKSRSISWLLSKFLSTGSFQLDYDHLPASVAVKCMERMYSHPSIAQYRDTDTVIPVMASGHVKNMHTAENVDRLLSLARTRFGDRLTFWTVREATAYWASRVMA